jgi:flagellar motor protein MotB
VSRRPRRFGPSTLFPVNVWPPFVDALTMVLAAFVLLTMVAFLIQRGLLDKLRARDHEVSQLREQKKRIESRLRTLAPQAVIEIDDGKVILQGEVLFDSGSDALKPEGVSLMTEIGRGLAALLKSEGRQMVLVGGHTDDLPIHDDHFASNWELSTARALAVTALLRRAGVPAASVVAAGFGQHHPRASNADESGRAQNRRIEVLLVPIHAVASR